MDNEEYLPIKVVFPSKGDYKPPPPARQKLKVFGTVDDVVRRGLAAQVADVKTHFMPSFLAGDNIPAVAKVMLKPEAVAKSYRPTDLFTVDTCPIIGGNKLGELYVSVLPQGLDELTKRLTKGTAKKVEANISTLSLINPYSFRDVLGGESLETLQARLKERRLPLRFRLFRHHSRAINATIDAEFNRLAAEAGVGEVQLMDYAEGLRVYCLRDVSPQPLVRLASFAGLQSLSVFPDYRIVRTAARTLANISAVNFPPPEPNRDYPIVGIIDGGTDPNNSWLQSWIAARHDFVPLSRQNHDHGSFVAGMIVHGRKLNHDDERFPALSSKIVDFAALDRDGEISEYDLITAMDEAIRLFPTVKVWNLSLGRSEPCGDDDFSELGAALDERSKRHGVLFVIAAGNYESPPLRSWPPQDGIAESDRICPPADAIRAITVGSLAHLETSNTCVRRGEPSPFSRRGPGPAYILKPEISFYGGNCDRNGQYVQTGVISVDGSGHISENIGTSFACPLASSLAANVHMELSASQDTWSPSLAKAMILHGAFMQNVPLTSERVNYSGLGCPPGIEQIVTCKQSAATIILQVPVRPKPDFEKSPFPIPRSLIDGESGLRCEIFMTLVYDPPLDRQFGVEYCRCNVSATLGTFGTNPKTGQEEYSREVHPVPKELNRSYEKDLVKYGYKWSPLKLYYRKFSRGPASKPWRLRLDMLTRSEFSFDEEQHVVLIITFRALAAGANVYNELVTEMNRLGWTIQDLRVRSRSRLQS